MSTIEFDSGYWEWWQAPRLDPFRDGQTNFGSTHRPSSVAAVQFDEGYDRQGRSSWRRFIALHRSGAMEAGFGGDVASEDGERRVFELIAMVGRIWSLLARYSDVVARYGCAGPFEVSIALLGTSDAALGNVGAGWADAIRSSYDPGYRCLEPNVLIRLEREAWPDNDEAVQTLAFAIGARIEDAWGVRERRYLAGRGEREGAFDVSQYYDGA